MDILKHTKTKKHNVKIDNKIVNKNGLYVCYENNK